MKTRISAVLIAAAFALLHSVCVQPQTFGEDFTGRTTNNKWFFYNGACLTAGTNTSTTNPNYLPACTTVLSTYYSQQHDHDPALVGGYLGCLGTATTGTAATPCAGSQTADPVITNANGVAVGYGALRFTNGYPYGHNENGAVVSGFTFPTNNGLEITFKTVTYLGDKGGQGDGADGMSFYLLDGCMPLAGGTVPSACSTNTDLTKKLWGTATTPITYPAIGAWGGSLAYTCSNANPPYDGLVGAYLGLGIDEYGNFLNGTTDTLGEHRTPSGDNTASGGGYYSGRIGMRGAGNISWQALTTAYGVVQSANNMPYYPASLANYCGSGTSYFAGTNSCNSCPVGTYNSSTGACDNASCPNGFITVNNYCYQCTRGGSTVNGDFQPGSLTCSNNRDTLTSQAFSITQPATTSSATSYTQAAVQKTCTSGHLWNYTDPNNPTDAGLADRTNTGNTAGIMDYAAIPNAYTELARDPTTGNVTLAAEGALTRQDSSVTPIFYDVKITQDGRLTFAYSLSGAAYTTVIKNKLITDSNGPLPNALRFGFAGSTGGSTNVHEVMCFKAVPSQESGGSTAVNEKQSAKIQSTTQAYFGYYNPTPTVWTGDVTANRILDTNGVISIESAAKWSASCVLNGASMFANATCPKTGQTTPASAQGDTNRVMLTYDPAKGGIPFQYTSLSATQKTALDTNGTTQDETTPGDRVNYLRGSRTNEIPKGAKEFRERDGVLADIVDSSPTWVGPPSLPYTAKWVDKLNLGATSTANEAGSGAQTYLDFVSKEQSRLNVVYVGSNDGFLHGFRTGYFDSSNNFINNSTSLPNDGYEVLAYMPNAVAKTIHNTASLSSNTTTTTGQVWDFSGTQYGHVFYVDATPGTGDIFYNKKWHTWLVGGLGAGGGAIYALDVTDPTGSVSGTTAFAESAASTTVIGEWDNTITCPNQTGATNCGPNLGNTYGTPIIRRMHNGRWAIIFGNGYGSSTNDAGIFVGVIDPSTGKPTFYYLSTGYAAAQKAANVTSPPANGIGYVSSADLDGDHITDYIYAGDLQGNVWRFDMTDTTDPSVGSPAWAVTPTPVFTAASGQPQPITSAIVVAIVPTSATGTGHRVMLGFGTGQRTQFTNTTPTQFTSGTQSIYGVWDWNMTAWNAKSSAKYASLTSTTATGLTSGSIQWTNLQVQQFSPSSVANVWDDTSNVVCWIDTQPCTSTTNTSPATNTNNQYGWYANLTGGVASTGMEQVIFNPTFYNGAFILDSTVPANNVPTTCTTDLDHGITYAVSMASGGALTSAYPQYHDTAAAGVQTDATGTPYIVTTAEGTTAFVYQTVGGAGGATQFNPPVNTKVKRLTWIQLR